MQKRNAEKADKKITEVSEVTFLREAFLRERHCAAFQWPEKWGFLVEEYDKLSECLTNRPINCSHRRLSNPAKPFKLPIIPERQPNLPKTDSKIYGWRPSVNPNCPKSK